MSIPGQRLSNAQLRIVNGLLDVILMGNYVFNYGAAAALEKETMDKFATLIMAEAGNQDLKGKRLVADVVLNRVDHGAFPDNVEDVIFQPYQFSCINDGNYAKCIGKATKDCYEAIKLEYVERDRLDSSIVFFSSTEYPVNGKNSWRHGSHWFSYY